MDVVITSTINKDFCDHLWQYLCSDPIRSSWDSFTSYGQQEVFYCSRDPNHRLRIPSEEKVKQMMQDVWDMLHEYRMEADQ